MAAGIYGQCLTSWGLQALPNGAVLISGPGSATDGLHTVIGTSFDSFIPDRETEKGSDRQDGPVTLEKGAMSGLVPDHMYVRSAAWH